VVWETPCGAGGATVPLYACIRCGNAFGISGVSADHTYFLFSPSGRKQAYCGIHTLPLQNAISTHMHTTDTHRNTRQIRLLGKPGSYGDKATKQLLPWKQK